MRSHPGLPNPAISKIIGEQWSHLVEEEKDKWKALAEVSQRQFLPDKPRIVLILLNRKKRLVMLNSIPNTDTNLVVTADIAVNLQVQARHRAEKLIRTGTVSSAVARP